MSNANRVIKLYSILKSGKSVTRSAIAKHLGYNESYTQALMKYFAERGIPVEASKVEGRAMLEFKCSDVAKFKEIVDNGGRMRVKAKVAKPAKTEKAAVKVPKGLSAKQAGKTSKRVTKAPASVKPTKVAEHLKDVTLWDEGDDRPAADREGKAAILDKELDIAAVSEREFNDIKSMLGIDF